MKAFIKSLVENAWRSVLTGQKHPTIKDDEGNVVLTPEVKWFVDNDRLSNYNSKALNANFNDVGADQIKLIIIYESAKEA